MRLNLFRCGVLTLTGLLAIALGPAAFSQSSDPLTVGLPVSVVRRTKVDRRAPKSKPVERAPLLKLEWRLYKVSASGSDEETEQRRFSSGDRLRFAVRTNQDGYLYVIHQKSRTSPGLVIFPDSKLNYGSSRIDKSDGFVLPSNCPVNVPRRDCSVVLTFSGGPELFHLFFTREPFNDLPASASDATDPIPATLLEKLEKESGQVIKRQKGSTPFSELLTNINTNDNEDIMEVITVEKR